MENQTKKNGYEIDIHSLIKVFTRFWIFILAATLLVGILVGVLHSSRTKPAYVGTASFWVVANDDSQASIMGAAQMATGYVELARKDVLVRSAVQNYGLKEKWGLASEDAAVAYLRSMISATKSYEESLMFSISVSSTNKEVTYDAICAVQYTMESVIAKLSADTAQDDGAAIVRVDEVFSLSDISVSVSSPYRYVLFAAVVAFILSYAICFVIFFLDKKIRDREILERLTDYPIIGNICADKAKRGVKKGDNNDEGAVVMQDAPESFNVMKTILLDSMPEATAIAVLPTSDKYSASFASQCLAASMSKSGKKVLCLCAAAAVGEESLAVAYSSEGLNVRAYEGKGDTLDGISLGCTVAELKSRYDMVIIDMPTLADVSEVGSLSKNVDGYVVLANKGADIRDVNSAAQLLRSVNAEVCGICYAE